MTITENNNRRNLGKELSARQRYKQLFRGKPIDRMPVCPRVFKNVVCEYFNTTDIDVLEAAAQYYRHFGMDIIDWGCGLSKTESGELIHWEFMHFFLEGPNWKPVIVDETFGDTKRKIFTFETPKGTLRLVLAITKTSPWEEEIAVTEHLIKTERDFDIIAEYMPPPPRADITGIADRIQRALKIIGEDGIVSPPISGVFNTLAVFYRKMDLLLMDITTNPDFYHRMMEFFLNRLFAYAQHLIDAGADLVDISANIASGSVVSPDYLVEHILPYENRLADYFQDRKVPALYHNCGHAARHLDVYHQLHHRLWGYLAPAPHGDTVLTEAIQKLPRELILWGHVDQIDFLRSAAAGEVEEKVKTICETVKPRGNFIVGTSDSLEPGTPHDNIHALVDAAKQYGRYE